MAKNYNDLDDLKRDLRSLPNIHRNITNVIDIEAIAKEMNKINERKLKRRIL